MFLINWSWAFISIILIFLLHRHIADREIEARWGALHSGVAFELARQSLLRLEKEAYHPKNWRPILLAFAMGSWNRPHLLVFAHWLTSGHGILTVAQVLQGDIEDHAERRDAYESTLRKLLAKQELQAFPRTSRPPAQAPAWVPELRAFRQAGRPREPARVLEPVLEPVLG